MNRPSYLPLCNTPHLLAKFTHCQDLKFAFRYTASIFLFYYVVVCFTPPNQSIFCYAFVRIRCRPGHSPAEATSWQASQLRLLTRGVMEYALAWLLSMVLVVIEFCNGVKLPLFFVTSSVLYCQRSFFELRNCV